MKNFISVLLLFFVLFFLFNTICFGENYVNSNEVDRVDTYDNVDNSDNSNITVLDLYSVFYLIAFILVVIFLYLFISHILRIR